MNIFIRKFNMWLLLTVFLLPQKSIPATGHFDLERCRKIFFDLLRPEARDTINHSVGRKTHPYIDSMFFILLPLVQEEVVQGKHLNKLQTVRHQLKHLAKKKFIQTLYLSPVYPQSVLSYEGYANTSYYWPAFYDGVDPLLGTKADYIDLVRTARSLKIDVVQDIVINHAGYIGKTEQERAHYMRLLEERRISVPPDLSDQLCLWGRWRKLDDPWSFHQMGEIPTEAYEEFDWTLNVDSFFYAKYKIQHGDLYGLKKLNLDNPEILNSVITDHMWYIRDAGVTKFRIDAAKHIHHEHLKELIAQFIEAAQAYRPKSDPAFILEFWTPNPRVQSFALRTLAPFTDYVYMLDYAFALTLRDALLVNPSLVMDPDRRHVANERKDFQVFADLIEKRWRYGLDIRTLIPIFIDHDFLLPIYDGSDQSVAILTFAYAMSFMMAGNAPLTYFAFDKPEFGPKDETVWTSGRLVIPRFPVKKLIKSESHVFRTINSLKETLSKHPVLTESKHVFVKEVSKNHIVLERRLDQPGIKLVAYFTRSGDPGWSDEGQLIWEYLSNTGPSVRIFSAKY